MSTEEKELKIKILKEKILELKNKENQYNAMQMGLKLLLNGTYGAFGNEYFVCSNKDIASAITSMGRELIQYMDKCNQEYWYNKWHLDTDLLKFLSCYIENEELINTFKKNKKHELSESDYKKLFGKYKTIDFLKELNIDYNNYNALNADKIDNTWINVISKENIILEEYTKEKLNKDYIDGIINRKSVVSVYADTDSLFIGFEPGLNSCKWPISEEMFIHLIYEFRLCAFFKDKLEIYAKSYGVKNIQDFELERINESILFLGKKTYIQHVRWEDGVEYESLKYLYPKGIQMVKSSTPPFARAKVYEIVQYLMSHPKDYTLKSMLALVKDIKKQFQLADIEDISQTISCSSYRKNVLDDVNELKFADDTFWATKTAAHHNFLMNQKQEYKDKYEAIKDGSKMKYYNCKNAQLKSFGYLRGSFPKEFAPEIDYDIQFEKTVLNQVNAFITALGLPELSKRLKVVLPLF